MRTTKYGGGPEGPGWADGGPQPWASPQPWGGRRFETLTDANMS